ncbi:T9SS type A sorting domain-containing protein [Flavobacterium sp. CS20]|uniref:T9SS type A sorting domain-containing protein n=1 Tax=Flavobacterium sp. CS20 TaxID=2775246 RepID=UPI001B39FE47|nr:T9SS type A sorting domain-containing protein [Flavobacterium sp. CS20]QTY27522.1 T9SS type A sorting domain-containing protein [Flavobacterium sp. CS20]
MKQLITAVAILLSVQVFAISDIQIRTNGNSEVIIEANKTTGEESIRIFDEKGTMLFFEKINKDKYVRTFKLSTLPNGKYFVEYENDSKINTAVILKKGDDIIVTSNFNQVSFKPMINQNGDYLSVGLTNPQLKNVSMSITDEKGFELTEIKTKNEMFVKKTFNTARLPKGDYSVQVKCGKESFTKLISIQ